MTKNLKRLPLVEPVVLPTGFEFLPGTPRTRGDCIDGPRPCPYLACKYHLWLELEQDQSGNWQRGRQGRTDIKQSSRETCALDVADRGVLPPTPEDVQAILGSYEAEGSRPLAMAIERVMGRGGATAEDVGRVLGIDDTRVRQLENVAMEKIKEADPDAAEYLPSCSR